ALVELIEHLVGLGLELGGDLVAAPARGNLVADLVHRAFARQRDADDLVPDITAAGLQRIVVDAYVACEGRRDEVSALRQASDRLAGRIAPRAVDGPDRHRRHADLLRGFGNAGAAAALVFHLALERRHRVTRAIDRDLTLDGAGDRLVVRLDAAVD